MFCAIVSADDAEYALQRLNTYNKVVNQIRVRDLIPIRVYPHVYDNAKRERYTFVEAYFYHIAFAIIALLLVVSAVTNMIMTYTSINLARVREYALRRSMGATAWQNVEWMLVGILPTLLLAILFAGVIMEWILELVEIPWDIAYINTVYRLMIALTVLLCLLGMAYPVYKMRRAYKASFLGYGDGGRSHLWLIVVQCFASAFLLFVTLGMQRQIYGMIHTDLGYDTKNILRLHTERLAEVPGFKKYYDFGQIYEDLTKELRKAAGVAYTDVVAMKTDIFNQDGYQSMLIFTEEDYHQRYSGIDWPERMECIELPFAAIDFFNIRTKSGNRMRLEDETPDALQVYLNPEAMRRVAPDGVVRGNLIPLMTGYYTPKDKVREHWFDKRLNIRDVADIFVADHHSAVKPVIFVGVEEFHPCVITEFDAIYIKYEDGRREEAEAAVRDVLRRFDVPEEQYMLTTFEEYIADAYAKEKFIANLLALLTTFSILITLAGVFSMLLYSLRLRRRSMAIHRVMGATFKDIFMPTLRPYLLYAVVGAVVAYFPAYILMRKWMEYFHYGETPGVGLMLLILAAMCGIIALIVWWQVSLCMREKPVEILKPES